MSEREAEAQSGYYLVRESDEREGWDVLGPPGSAEVAEDGHPTDEREWLATFYSPVALQRFINAGTQRCPCTLVEPCRRNCSCGNGLLSGGCHRCASYGSAEQRQAMAEHLARRFQALEEFASESPIQWQGEDEVSYAKRRVWCQWCEEGMLATEYRDLEDQRRNFPHKDDCTWVLAGGREV